MNSGGKGSDQGSKSAEPYQSFKPHPVMKKFLYWLTLGILSVSILGWTIPLSITVREPVVFWVFGVGAHVLYVILAFLFIVWVPRYYDSISYRIEDGWLEAQGGVVWQNKSRLPVSRIQLVDISQGPLQRKYGVCNVLIHTAAKGAESRAELGFINIENGEALRERILSEAKKAPVSRTDGFEATHFAEQEDGHTSIQEKLTEISQTVQDILREIRRGRTQ